MEDFTQEIDILDSEIQEEYGLLTRLYFSTDEESINLIGERSGAFGFTEEYFWVEVRAGEDFRFFVTLEEATADAAKRKKPFVYEGLFQTKQLAKAITNALNPCNKLNLEFMVREVLSFSKK